MDNEQKMPLGIILILIYIGLGIVFSLGSFFSLLNLDSWSANALKSSAPRLLFIAVPMILFFGILKRFKWARITTIILGILSLGYGLIMIPIIIGVFSLLSEVPQVTSYSTYATYAIIAANWVASLLIVIYLSKKKDFFVR